MMEKTPYPCLIKVVWKWWTTENLLKILSLHTHQVPRSEWSCFFVVRERVSPGYEKQLNNNNNMSALCETGADKDQFVTSLAALVCADSSVDVTAENINAVINASGNNVAAYWATLFATSIEKAGGAKKFFPTPGAAAPAGAAAAPAGAAPAAKAAEAPKPVVEEVDALEGGMDMFGGGGGGGDY
jgi:large subunit ribosomal protein LP1